jgi:hypothetical protein
MKNAEAVLSVKFSSTFDSQLLMETLQVDLDTFREVPGLIEKYYLEEEGTRAISGIYLFQSKSSRAAFLSSELAKNIPSRYGVIPDTLRIEQYDVAIVLNEYAPVTGSTLDC